MYILGVRVDTVSRREIPEMITRFLRGEEACFIATPNPEMLVMASRDRSFSDILNHSALNVADGIGLVFLAPICGNKIPERITGVDMVYFLAERAATLRKRIYFLGGKNDVMIERAANHFRTLFPGLDVSADHGGSIIRTQEGTWQCHPEVVARIQHAAPDILVVALGHGKQERFIHDHLNLFPGVRIAIGVGGALDVYAGLVPRAPRFLQAIGLEWLWRLFHEPWRLRRIITAVVIFPFLVITKR